MAARADVEKLFLETSSHATSRRSRSEVNAEEVLLGIEGQEVGIT